MKPRNLRYIPKFTSESDPRHAHYYAGSILFLHSLTNVRFSRAFLSFATSRTVSTIVHRLGYVHFIASDVAHHTDPTRLLVPYSVMPHVTLESNSC
jgi:hypothetical protein